VTGATGATPNVIAVHQVAHGFTVGQVLRRTGSAYVLAQADTPANAEVIGMVSTVVGVDDFVLTTQGQVTVGGGFGISAGLLLFLSASVAGGVTNLETATAGQVSKPIAICDSSTTLVMFNMRGETIAASAAAPLTGQITTTGTITAGSGFTAARNSAGNYTITFTAAFSAAPVVLATVVNSQPIVVDLVSVAAGSFTIEFRTAAGVATDQNWQFMAQAML
jgi:hypothetical protein